MFRQTLNSTEEKIENTFKESSSISELCLMNANALQHYSYQYLPFPDALKESNRVDINSTQRTDSSSKDIRRSDRTKGKHVNTYNTVKTISKSERSVVKVVLTPLRKQGLLCFSNYEYPIYSFNKNNFDISRFEYQPKPKVPSLSAFGPPPTPLSKLSDTPTIKTVSHPHSITKTGKTLFSMAVIIYRMPRSLIFSPYHTVETKSFVRGT